MSAADASCGMEWIIWLIVDPESWSAIAKRNMKTSPNVNKKNPVDSATLSQPDRRRRIGPCAVAPKGGRRHILARAYANLHGNGAQGILPPAAYGYN